MTVAKFKTVSSVIALAVTGVAFMPQAVLAQAAPAGATSADAGTEIVVTAQRREERSRDVPITITTLSQDQLTTANVKQLSDIAKLTPSLRFDNQAAFAQPTIRGIGTSVTTSGGGANVGIYIDGFYSPNPLAADMELMNVRNVQVLKGPQGTLFGRNTTGGAILIQTAEPSHDPSVAVKASYARFNELHLQGYATAGIGENVAYDIEGSYRRGDGFQTDLTGNSKIGRHESWSVRTGGKFDFSPDVSLLVRYSHSHVNDPQSMLAISFVDPVIGNVAPWFAPSSTTTTNPDSFAGDVPNRVITDADVLQGTLRADLGFANLTSYTQYRTEKTDMSEDLDHTAMTNFQLGLPIKDETFSQELLLTSKAGTSLQWTAGLFYFSTKDSWRTFVDNGQPTYARVPVGGSGTTTRSFAAFLDATYEVVPQVFVTLGGRYSHDQIDNAYYIPAFSGTVVNVTQAQADAVKKDRFTPRVVLRYKPSDASSIYASYTKGYKAGILDVGGSTGNPVAPETVDAFEVGYKYDDRVFSFEAAGFYYDYKNLQVSLFKGNPPSAQIINAASSEIYGAEAQMRYRVGSHFDVNAGATWTHGRYKHFDNAPIYVRCTGDGVPDAGCVVASGVAYVVPSGTVLTNVTMQHLPEFTGNIGARYHTPAMGGEFALSGNLYYTSKFYFGPSGIQFPQEGYEVLSMRAQWNAPEDRYYVAVFGDNLTDRRYKTQVQYNNFGVGATYSAPVTYGIEIGAKF